MTIIDHEIAILPTPTGSMQGYVFRPSDVGLFPGIFLFSEIYQVSAPIRRTAAMLAGHGFIVIVPEVWHELEPAGTLLPYSADGTEIGNRHKTEKPIGNYDTDSAACIAFLEAHPSCTGRIGTLGICLGGHLAFRAAFLPQVRAAVTLYATDLHKKTLGLEGDDGSLARASAGEITGEMLLIWGRQDPHVPAEGRREIHDALTAASVNFTWHEFNAQHAFLRDEGPRYDPALALQVYSLITAFFARTLAG